MPTRAQHAQRRGRLKAEIVGRIAAGQTLTAVCASEGLPPATSVCRWALSDPSFADELAEAQRRGTWRRRRAFDDAKARTLLARMAAGEPLASIHRDPAMPTRPMLRYWRATQGEF